jgi:hypothetical protein
LTIDKHVDEVHHYYFDIAASSDRHFYVTYESSFDHSLFHIFKLDFSIRDAGLNDDSKENEEIQKL